MRSLNLLSVLLLSLVSALMPVQAAVEVTINTTRYQFTTTPRLTEVLAPVALQARWYWPAAALYQLDDTAPEQLRQSVLQQIAALQHELQGNTAMLATLAAVESQVRSWHLAKRVTLQIDYDAATIDPAHNPRFDSGNYLLRLTERPTQLYVFGAVSMPQSIMHQSATTLAKYRLELNYTAAALQHELVVLRPDGAQQRVGIAAWNASHVEAMPGSQLFVPIKAPLFDQQVEALNQSLLALAVHRVLP